MVVYGCAEEIVHQWILRGIQQRRSGVDHARQHGQARVQKWRGHNRGEEQGSNKWSCRHHGEGRLRLDMGLLPLRRRLTRKCLGMDTDNPISISRVDTGELHSWIGRLHCLFCFFLRVRLVAGCSVGSSIPIFKYRLMQLHPYLISMPSCTQMRGILSIY